MLILPTLSASVETDFLDLLNKERASLGLSQVVLNAELTQAAYLHSQDMAQKNYLSHTSQDGTTFVQRIINAKYTNYISLAENIAYHSGATPDANKVFQMWKGSPGHYTNMKSSNNEIGLGVYVYNNKVYYTLDMGKRRDVVIPSTTPTPSTNVTQPQVVPPTPKEPVIQPTTLKLNVTYATSKSRVYYYYKIYIKTNAPAQLKYKIGTSEKIISTRASSKSLFLRSKTPLDNIEIIATDKKGNTDSKFIDFN